jgi:tRNA A-37 threonylcarbamoyl transferase component Bud32
VLGFASRTLQGWGIPGTSDDGGDYFGLVMEWLQDGEILSVNNINLSNACLLIKGLSRIHYASILHSDLYRRNMMVFPGSRRAVWIDFSCARIDNDLGILAQELWSASGIIIQLVFWNQ